VQLMQDCVGPILHFMGSASLCVSVGALNSMWAIDIARQNWLVSVNLLPDTFRPKRFAKSCCVFRAFCVQAGLAKHGK
jgi:hypothetical protein